jgi:hypothetical protein
LAFLNDIGLRLLPARGLSLLAQDFLGERIRHVNDGGIDPFLIGAQGQEIRRDTHHDIHQRKIDHRRQVICDRGCGLQKARGEMGNQIRQRHLHFAGRKLAQDHIHRNSDFRRRRSRGFKL